MGRGTFSRREALVVGGAAVVSACSAVALGWKRLTSGADAGPVNASPSPPRQAAEVATPTPAPADTPPPAEPAPPEEAPPTEEPAAEAPVTPLEVLCRASWGAAAAGAGVPHTIEQVTVHHSAVVLADNRRAPQRLRDFQQLHQGARGWSDLAYHYVIDAEGNVYEGRAVDAAGDTATDYDPTGHFLAMCDGNFEEQDIPEPQLDALARTVAWGVQRYGVSPDRISSHRDHATTACPGAALHAHVRSGELGRRVAAYLAGAPLELRLVCGADADRRIAAIEAGIPR